MTDTDQALRTLLDKDAIRDLVLRYSRAIDRKDPALLRTLYTEDATDTHGDSFDGSAADYCDFIERSMPYMRYSGHHICNHLVTVDGDTGEGEAYAISCHVVPDRAGGWIEDVRWVRYLDRYRRDDGVWRFAKRVVTYDYITRRPTESPDVVGEDASYAVLTHTVFRRGVPVARG